MSATNKIDLSPEKMVKQAQKTKGYLLKKSSSLFTPWKQRYFLIINSALMYYEDETLENLKGEIKIKQIQLITPKQNDLFTLQTPKKLYQFKCVRQQDKDLWIASLNLIKQSLSDKEFGSRIMMKKVESEKKSERFQLCKVQDIKSVLLQMKLLLLADQLDESRIHQRIYCQKINDEFYLSISIKILQPNQFDEEILAEKYIMPYNFNKLYKIDSKGNVEDLAKMSQMQSLKSFDGSVVITFSDKKKITIPYKNDSEAYEISRKLCRCYQVAKEYYNPFKIVLKKNIDKLVNNYDNNKHDFQHQIRKNIQQHFRRVFNSQAEPVTVFLSEFRFIKKDLMEIEEACKVMSPSRDDVKFSYLRISNDQVRVGLSKIWQSLYAVFDLKSLIIFSSELYEYWIIVNQGVSDSSILDGCVDLNKFFVGRVGESIREKIYSYNGRKIEAIKVKNEPLANPLTAAFYEWLRQLSSCLSQTIPIEAIFDEYCKFLLKCFDEFLQYMSELSEKWNQVAVIAGACNDLSKIRKFFKQNIVTDVCKGIFAEKIFLLKCGNQTIKKINEAIGNLIRRAFLIYFKTIDKKILAKPFIQIDFGKICYEVLQRLEPIKPKLVQDIQYQMIILSFDQICFFLYTTYINRNIPLMKNVKEVYIKNVQKGLTDIQQYYCNIKTQQYVKQYLRQVFNLRQVLACQESFLPQIVSDLSRLFGTSFKEESLEVILLIRQTSEQNFRRLLEVSLNSIKNSPSSEDSQSFQQNHIRSRKSTLNESLYLTPIHDHSRVSISKFGKEGYLDIKKIVKGIPGFFSRAYFKIKDGDLLQYYSHNSSQIISSICLNYVDYCNMDSHPTERCTFLITMDSTTYYFRAQTRDQAGLWIQAICTQMKRPIFQNRGYFPQNKKVNALFRNFETELTTTSSNKLKNGEAEQQDRRQKQKRKRRKQMEQKQIKKDRKNSSPPKSHQAPLQIRQQKTKKNKTEKISKIKEDEGTCCTSKMF